MNTGPAGDAVRSNVRALRLALGLTYAALAEHLARAGNPIPTLGLRRLEFGERKISVDDLVALADALGVTAALLMRAGATFQATPRATPAAPRPRATR